MRNLEQELARKDQALDEIRALIEAWAGKSFDRKCAGADCAGCAYAKCGHDLQRILAALDAQLNKEDDDQ